jgi:GNAT superfamily N-acetyltransferase
MRISVAESDESILAAFDAMKHLRELDDAQSFLRRVRQQQHDGYLLVSVAVDGRAVAAAGFRLGEKLAWGRHLYVDDLVTIPSERSRGFGRALLNWLKSYARDAGCSQLHLDSGVQRKDAHRFYEREGLVPASVHFRCDL